MSSVGITGQSYNLNGLLLEECLAIKRRCLSLNSGLKASKEFQLF